MSAKRKSGSTAADNAALQRERDLLALQIQICEEKIRKITCEIEKFAHLIKCCTQEAKKPKKQESSCRCARKSKSDDEKTEVQKKVEEPPPKFEEPQKSAPDQEAQIAIAGQLATLEDKMCEIKHAICELNRICGCFRKELADVREHMSRLDKTKEIQEIMIKLRDVALKTCSLEKWRRSVVPELKAILTDIEFLKSTKADREDIIAQLELKANREELNDYVTKEPFNCFRSNTQCEMTKIMKQVQAAEIAFDNFQKEIRNCMESKANIADLISLKKCLSCEMEHMMHDFYIKLLCQITRCGGGMPNRKPPFTKNLESCCTPTAFPPKKKSAHDESCPCYAELQSLCYVRGIDERFYRQDPNTGDHCFCQGKDEGKFPEKEKPAEKAKPAPAKGKADKK